MLEIDPNLRADQDDDEVVLWNTELYLHNIQHPTSIDLEPRLNQEVSSLFDNFFNSPFAIKVIQLLREAQEVDSDFRRAIAGRIFKEVCLPWVQRCIDPKLITLSSDETSKLYHLANPQREVREFFQVNVGIQGMSLPDYLILKINHNHVSISGWGECKLGIFWNRGETQLGHLIQPDSVAQDLKI